jgi:hypothetical protein
MTKTAERRQKARKPAAKRVAAAKPRPKKPVAKRIAGKRPAADYVVFESPIEPRHFTVEQIRRAVKAVING